MLKVVRKEAKVERRQKTKQTVLLSGLQHMQIQAAKDSSTKLTTTVDEFDYAALCIGRGLVIIPALACAMLNVA